MIFGKPLSEVFRLTSRANYDYLTIWIKSEIAPVGGASRIVFATPVNAVVF